MSVLRQRRSVARIPGFKFLDRWCATIPTGLCCAVEGSGTGETDPIVCAGHGRLPRHLNITLTGRDDSCGQCGIIPYDISTPAVIWNTSPGVLDRVISYTLNFWPNESLKLKWYANAPDNTYSDYYLTGSIAVPAGTIQSHDLSNVAFPDQRVGSSAFALGSQPNGGINVAGGTVYQGQPTPTVQNLWAAPAPCPVAIVGDDCDGWLAVGNGPASGLYNNTLTDKYVGQTVGGGLGPVPFTIYRRVLDPGEPYQKRPMTITYKGYRQLHARLGCSEASLYFNAYIYAFVSYHGELGPLPGGEDGTNWDLVPFGSSDITWAAVPVLCIEDGTLRVDYGHSACESLASPVPVPFAWVAGNPRGQITAGTTTLDLSV